MKAIDRWPARLDMLQGVTGLVLVLFMWAHMFLVSSILISKDAMYYVTRLFEGEPLFGKAYPVLVSLVAVFIFVLVLVHAALAMRKFPADYARYRAFVSHLMRLKHPDTWLWTVQVVTGFLLLFLICVHLYQLMLHPADIGPYASSDRVYTGLMWPLYLVLLLLVEIHAGIGIYRLALKWGVFFGKSGKSGNSGKAARRRLSRIKWAVTCFFLVLGLFTLLAYYQIGAQHAPHAGERYLPQALQPGSKGQK